MRDVFAGALPLSDLQLILCTGIKLMVPLDNAGITPWTVGPGTAAAKFTVGAGTYSF